MRLLWLALLIACGGRDPDCEAPRAHPPGTCVADTDCPGACVRAREGDDGTFVELACGGPATVGSPCSAAEDCGGGLCAVAGTCRAPCLADDDCDPGARCATTWVHAGAGMQRAHLCVPVVAAEVEAERSAGAGRRWALPTGEALHVLRTACAPRWLRVEDETGLLFDQANRGGARNPVFTVQGGAPALWVPSGDGPVGDDLVAVFDRRFAAERITFRGAPPGRVLDLDLFYVGLRWTPEGTRGPPELAAALDRLETILTDAAGLRLGEVRQHRFLGAAAERFAVIERDSGELAELFGASAGTLGPSVPIFLVREVEGSLALSGGIPGPIGVPGLSSSGIAVGVEAAEGADLGRLLAHELGHFLGLFHTTELDGTVIEALGDTPACEADADTNGDGLVSVSECRGRGADNLMFWSVVATGTELSASQRSMLQRATILRP